MKKTKITLFCACSLLALSAVAQVQGAGSSLARGLMGAWSTQHGAASGGVTYEATGSSAGVRAATEQTVDFGVSDVPLTAPALRQAGLKQVPLAVTAVAVVVNLPELAGKPIKLTGDMIADIYQGTITQWNHSQIAAANAGVKLPSKPIVPIWRADGSGQSYVFSTYLSRGNPKWRRVIAATSNLQLSAGRGVRGGQGVLDAVKATPGAIGYDALGDAKASGLLIAELQNAAGKYVAPSSASVAAATEQATWQSGTNTADLDGSVGADIYPMATVTYALLPIAPKAGRKNAGPFIALAVAQGDQLAQKAGFNALPVVAKNLAALAVK